eukprot:532273_1
MNGTFWVLLVIAMVDAVPLPHWSWSSFHHLYCLMVVQCIMYPLSPAAIRARLTSDLNVMWWLNGSNLNVTQLFQYHDKNKGAFSQLYNHNTTYINTTKTTLRQSKHNTNITFIYNYINSTMWYKNNIIITQHPPTKLKKYTISTFTTQTVILSTSYGILTSLTHSNSKKMSALSQHLIHNTNSTHAL